MVHSYSVTGIHCGNCVQRITTALLGIPNVELVDLQPEKDRVTITMREHIATSALNDGLKKVGNYSLQNEVNSNSMTHQIANQEEEKSLLKAYYPLLLVFGFILGLVFMKQLVAPTFSTVGMMSDFMGGFFIAFSFFKLLDIPGFAASYSSYDIITKKWFAFGYIYPFIELAFGIGYLFFPMYKPLYLVTLVVMSVSIIGVLQSVMNKRKIKCACLGTVFNLPMGTITIIEDGLMIAMSLAMLFITM